MLLGNVIQIDGAAYPVPQGTQMLEFRRQRSRSYAYFGKLLMVTMTRLLHCSYTFTSIKLLWSF